MLKLLFCSDIHRDAGSTDQRMENVVAESPDILVHCGDLSGWGTWEASVKWLRLKLPDAKLLIVPGNHDFYCYRNLEMGEIESRQAKICEDNGAVYLPIESYKVNDSLYIAGSSLWYDYSFKTDRDYSEREIEEGYGNGIQWNDMKHIDVGTSDPEMAALMLVRAKQMIASIPAKANIIFASHMCPHEELNAHAPSLFNAYSGQKKAGVFLDSLGDRLLAAYCGHTHREKTFGKYINIGSDYYGPVKYRTVNV